MTAFDDAPDLDKDLVIGTIYRIQADLRLLVETLARDRNPSVSDGTLLDLVRLQFSLEGHTPSLRRH